ncbi:MAG: hypothetical protein ACYTEG_17995, partial [Planctomycetota bacterium]
MKWIWLVANVVALGVIFWTTRDDEPVRNRAERAEPPQSKSIKIREPDEQPVPSSEAVSVRARGIWEKTTGRAPTDEEWAKVQAATEQAREQLQRQMEAAEILEAHKLAQQTKEEARRLEDAKRGGTMEFLRGLGKSPARLPKLVANADEFAIHFARKAEGPLV